MAETREDKKKGCGDQKTFTLTEYPDIELIKNIFRHPDLFDEQKKRIRKYCCKASKKGQLDIKYIMKSKYGRYYTEDYTMLSGNSMWRKLRSSLFAKTEYDIDIKSAHFQILINDVAKYMQLEKLQNLINNRDELFKSFYIDEKAICRYNYSNKDDLTKKDVIKKLLTRTLYGGLFENWVKEFELEREEYTIPDWWNDVKEDLQQGNIFLMKMEGDLFNDIKLDCLTEEQQKWDLEQIEICKRDKRRKPKPFNPADFNVPKPKLLAKYYQNQERLIIDRLYEFVKEHYKIRPTTYCFDGLQFRRESIKDIDEFMKTINNEFNVKFEVKDFDEPLSIMPIYVEPDYFDIKEFNMLNEEWEKIAYFNKFYFRIIALNGMCYYDADKQLKTIKNNKVGFAKLWDFWNTIEISEHIKEYQGLGTYPLRHLCPKQNFNLFDGFDCENFPKDITGSYDKILYHFKVVANYDETLYEYLLNYFAHILQKPNKKTCVCLLVKGEQGTGKTTLCEVLMRKLLGKKYVYDTSDIDKIVGKFNGSIAGKFMVCLNEASGKDIFAVMDKIKDMITREFTTLEYKGIDAIEVTDFINYCLTTNNLKPLPLSKDDRRFQVMQISNKYKGNIKYFNELYAQMDDTASLKSFYDFLMQRDIKRFNPSGDRVTTNATLELIELNKDPIELFVEHLYSDNFNKYKTQYTQLEIYEEYKSAMNTYNYKPIGYINWSVLFNNFGNQYNFKSKKIKNKNYFIFEWETECLLDCDSD